MAIGIGTINPPAPGSIDWDRVFTYAGGALQENLTFRVACSMFAVTDPDRFDKARRRMGLTMAEAMA